MPEERIARFPAVPRDHSRLLHAPLAGGVFEHLRFFELGKLLRAGDVLVVNTTRVLKARLFGENAKGRKFEILLLEPENGATWNTLVRPGKHIADTGSELLLPGGWTARVARHPRDDRRFQITFPQTGAAFAEWLETHGHMPLPPYLKRPDQASDTVDYQTVYAQEGQSVAAPTAGLHFTPELMESLQNQGVAFEKITLDVGYGTFAPLEPSAQELHAEPYEIPADVDERLARARAEGRRVIAVGTTSLRALEASATQGPCATTRIFIRPGYRFARVDGLITNFHLPQSSLFILVAALMGIDRAQSAYREALAGDYRFFSFGDAMAIL